MIAIPFICSRTKYRDFIADYLVRPDFQWQNAKSLVANAMFELDTLDDFRYAVFSADKYCFFGVGCLSKILVAKTGIDANLDFLRDEKNRSLACFIGFAVPVSEGGCTVPDIASNKFMKILCDTYFKHLQKQWNSQYVISEVISLNDTENTVELPELKILVADEYKPSDIEATGKGVQITEHFDKTYLYYYLHQIINCGNYDANFISCINYEEQWQKLKFKNAAISETLYANLPAIQRREDEKTAISLVQRIDSIYRTKGQTYENDNINVSKKLNCAKILANCICDALKEEHLDSAEQDCSKLQDTVLSIRLSDLTSLLDEISTIRSEIDKIYSKDIRDFVEEKIKSLEKIISDNKTNQDKLNDLKNHIKSFETNINEKLAAQKRLKEAEERFSAYEERVNAIKPSIKDDYEKLHNFIKQLEGINKQLVENVTEPKLTSKVDNLKRCISFKIKDVENIIKKKKEQEEKAASAEKQRDLEWEVLVKFARNHDILLERLQKRIKKEYQQNNTGIVLEKTTFRKGTRRAFVVHNSCAIYCELYDIYRLVKELKLDYMYYKDSDIVIPISENQSFNPQSHRENFNIDID